MFCMYLYMISLVGFHNNLCFTKWYQRLQVKSILCKLWCCNFPGRNEDTLKKYLCSSLWLSENWNSGSQVLRISQTTGCWEKIKADAVLGKKRVHSSDICQTVPGETGAKPVLVGEALPSENCLAMHGSGLLFKPNFMSGCQRWISEWLSYLFTPLSSGGHWVKSPFSAFSSYFVY